MVSCAAPDPAPPWVPGEMMRQLQPEFRPFEESAPAFSETEILAWRVDTEPAPPPSLPPIPLPGGSGFVAPQERRVESVLLWRRRGSESAPIDWALVQVYRFPDAGTPWQRATIHRELQAPLTILKPGEDAYGTWHGYQRYDRPPSSLEACDFAAVAFLPEDRRWRRISGVLRHRTWSRVLGKPPACSFSEVAVAQE